jgi:tetratricopeptide (TPR) repeat protein
MKNVLSRYGCAALLFLSLTGLAAHGDEAGEIFLRGVAAYKSGDFDQSVTAFETLAGRGIRNGKLFYNLGNACLKQDRLGHAVLWYERALRLMPDDPDLKFNYDYALSLTRDERGPSESPLLRILFFWKYLFAPKQLQWLSIIFNGIFWLVLILRQILKRSRLKTLSYGVFLLAAVSTLTVVYNAYEAAYVREGVILAAEAPVRSGLTDQATELFLLHAGAKVRIEREKGDYYRIRYSEGKIGWIEKSEVGRI